MGRSPLLLCARSGISRLGPAATSWSIVLAFAANASSAHFGFRASMIVPARIKKLSATIAAVKTKSRNSLLASK